MNMARCLLALALMSSGLCCQEDEVKAVRPPNIILIMADDIGIECFGSYGGTSYQTSHIGRMAEEGMRFTHCYSQPLCTPSRVKIMTGRSNARNYRAFSVLPPGERTFAHELRDAGYKTAVAGKWQLYAAEHYPKKIKGTGTLPGDAGFDAWCLWQIEKLGKRYWGPSYSADGRFVQAPKRAYGPDTYANYLISFIEKNKGGPFLAYFPMALVHNPFVPSPGDGSAKDKRDPRHFASMVKHMDRVVGRIIDKVQELGIDKETLILFTGDNGTNRKIRSKMGGRVVRGGKGKTDATGNHVPLIAWWPGRVRPGTICDDLVDFADFLPTFLALAKRPASPDLHLDGRSFLPQLLGQKGRPHDSLYCYYHPRPLTRKKSVAVRFAFDKEWKLYGDGRLFDLGKDRAETKALKADDDSAELEKVRARLQSRLNAMAARPDKSQR